MRLLVVTTRSPYPLIEGRALRTYNLLREAARKHEVLLCTYVLNDDEQVGLEHLRGVFTEVHGLSLYRGMTGKYQLLRDIAKESFSRLPMLAVKYGQSAMRVLIRRLIASRCPDLVQLDMLHLASLIADVRGLPTVLVEHNVESALLERRVQNEASSFRKRYWNRQFRKVSNLEALACGAADCVVTMSEGDSSVLSKLNSSGRYAVVPNGVDTEYFKPIADRNVAGTLIYVGGLSWFPNRDAIQYFSEAILPEVARRLPNVRLTVVGQVPDTSAVKGLQASGHVQFTGLVKDIRPYMSSAAAYIVPLRIGGGTRLKILDAMAMGKAIISTSIGCEGLQVHDGRDILIADDPATSADKVIQVLTNAALARDLGIEARATVEQHYKWPALAQRMEAVYSDAIAEHATRHTRGSD